MLMYVALMLAVFLCGRLCYATKRTKRNNKTFCNITIVMMCLVQCLRASSVGEDTSTYLEWFDQIAKIESVKELLNWNSDIDIGYKLFNYFLSRITVSHQILIIIVSCAIVILHIKFIQKVSADPFISVNLFIGMNFFLTSMVSWRQFLAMGIVFWMYPLLMERKYLKAVFVLCIACCFHDTAIVFGVVVVLINLFAKRKNHSVLILLLGIASLPILNSILHFVLKFLPAYNFYINEPIGNSKMPIGELRILYIVFQILLIGLVLHYERLTKNKLHGLCRMRSVTTKICKTYSELNVLTALMSCAIICGLYSAFIPYAFRLGYYFDYFMILLIPLLIRKFSKNKKALGNLSMGMSALLFVYYLSTNPGETLPYRFFFQ